MKTLIVALIAMGLVVPVFARMEQDQPKAEKKAGKKKESPKKPASKKKAEQPKAQ
jgi:hypothetical protein